MCVCGLCSPKQACCASQSHLTARAGQGAESGLLAAQGNGRHGTLSCEGVEYPLALQDVPTQIELLKSKNDTDYVKGGDVGQVPSSACLPALLARCAACTLQVSAGLTDAGRSSTHRGLRQALVCKVLLVRRPGAAQPSSDEYPYGLTPPLRNVKDQVFAPKSTLEPARLRHLSEQLLQICEVCPAAAAALRWHAVRCEQTTRRSAACWHGKTPAQLLRRAGCLLAAISARATSCGDNWSWLDFITKLENLSFAGEGARGLGVSRCGGGVPGGCPGQGRLGACSIDVAADFSTQH